MIAGLSERLSDLGLKLPSPPVPRGAYMPVLLHDRIAYVSGQVSRIGEEIIPGPATHDTSAELAARGGQACILSALSALADALDGTHELKQILFLRGFIHVAPGFATHSRFLDPASELLLALFGTRGRHARSAVGVSGLPGGGLLEIELVAAIG